MSRHVHLPKPVQGLLILTAMVLAWLISASWSADASPRGAGEDPVAVALLGPAAGQ